MSLRTKLLLYWVCLHLTFALTMAWLLRNDRLWLLLVELLLLLSATTAFRLVRHFFRPMEILQRGMELMNDQHYGANFTLTGQADIDRIVSVYNRMLHHLRQERLRIQEKHFFLDKIIQASPSGILTLDYDDRVTLVNPRAEKLFGQQMDSLSGKKLSEVDHPLAEELNRLETGQSTVLTLSSRRRIRCVRSEFYDQGFPRTFFLLEELTEELRLSEKAAYEKLIRILSHEVNNSIGAANSLLHSCLYYKPQLREEDQPDFQQAIEVVISRAEHLNAFMRSYVNVIRLAEPMRQLSDVGQMLEHVLRLFKAELAERQITVEWIRETPLDTMALLDRNQLEQVFINIIKNAVEAMNRNGRLTIRMGSREKRLFVSIEDTGGGIPAEVKAHLFTPFFSTKEHGQGIGLTLIQEILSRHRFDFSLESTPGRSTQFSIYF